MGVLQGRYKPLNIVLTGGQGRIELFEDTFLQRKVALKTIIGLDDQRRLLDEIAALGSIKSKHVVQVYDVLLLQMAGTREPALVLEFVEGDDLYTIAAQQRPPTYVNALLYQLARGIADIHAAGLVHRDINPSNAKVDVEGVLKVFDFGLARGSNALRTIGSVGTPGFMAPELRTEGGGTVYFGQDVDAFAFGATAHYMYTRQPPDLSHPSSFSAFGFSEFSAQMLDATLSTDPAQRPTMHELMTALSDELLLNQHQARVISGNSIGMLNSEIRRVRVDGETLGSCFVDYDGATFRIAEAQGDIYINNRRCGNGSILRESCLITIGAPHNGPLRVFVTFDISHPEVIL